MKTIKMIDLLIKNANGEEMPREIIFENYRYYKHPEGYFRSVINSNWIALTTDFNIYDILNDEVEILEKEPRDIEVCGSLFTKSEYDKLAHSEETKKIPEKITINDNGTIGFPKGEWTARNMDKAFAMKINSIIDYLKSKEDE